MATVKKVCATCAHDGQCDGLPYCGGTHWAPNEPDEELEEGEVIYAVVDETKDRSETHRESEVAE